MAEYYLISQLPSLDGLGDNTPIPIDEKRFSELCERFLNKKNLHEIRNLTLVPSINSENSNSTLIKKWNEGERNLRLALAKVRADKMKQSYDLQNRIIPYELLKTATTAADIENPLECEKFLLQYRLVFLETLKPMDSFSDDFIFYYGLKLKLISRIRQFDTSVGELAYKKAYNSIINRERLEVYQ